MRMAMCTSKPIIGKDAGGGTNAYSNFSKFIRFDSVTRPLPKDRSIRKNQLQLIGLNSSDSA